VCVFPFSRRSWRRSPPPAGRWCSTEAGRRRASWSWPTAPSRRHFLPSVSLTFEYRHYGKNSRSFEASFHSHWTSLSGACCHNRRQGARMNNSVPRLIGDTCQMPPGVAPLRRALLPFRPLFLSLSPFLIFFFLFLFFFFFFFFFFFCFSFFFA